MQVDYNQLAEQYRIYRRPDPRIAARIRSHIQGARIILNTGAGMGSYEPEGCDVISLELSWEMIKRRINPGSIPVQGSAESLPFRDRSFDVSTALLTIHHWSDIESGLKEMLRVTRDKIVLFTWTGYGNNFWLEDYLPEIRGVDIKLFPTLKELKNILGNITVEILEIPHDCTDGFMCAYWRRPEAYLNPEVRRAISTFSRIPDVQERLKFLREDITSGAWQRRYGHLPGKESMDLGYRIVVSEVL